MTPAEPEAMPAPQGPALVAAASVNDAAPAAVATVAQAAPAPAPTPTPVAPPPPAPPAPAVPAAVAAGKYIVNIGSFSNVANANALVARLRAQQLPVVADKVTLANGSAMRVRVGPYADRATAEAARLRAEEVTGTAARSSPPTPRGRRGETGAAPHAGSGSPRAPPKPAPAPRRGAEARRRQRRRVGFAVQLSAPSVEADANALRDKARAQGLSAFVQPVETDSGRRYRVRVGPVADRAARSAARRKRGQARQQGHHRQPTPDRSRSKSHVRHHRNRRPG
jgi:cell division septation protein DedD